MTVLYTEQGSVYFFDSASTRHFRDNSAIFCSSAIFFFKCSLSFSKEVACSSMMLNLLLRLALHLREATLFLSRRSRYVCLVLVGAFAVDLKTRLAGGSSVVSVSVSSGLAQRSPEEGAVVVSIVVLSLPANSAELSTRTEGPVSAWNNKEKNKIHLIQANSWNNGNAKNIKTEIHDWNSNYYYLKNFNFKQK